MRISVLLAALILLARLSLAQTGGAPPPSPGAVPPPDVEVNALALQHALPNFSNWNEVEAFLDGYIDARMRSDHINGVTLSIVKDGDVLLSKGYGMASEVRPVRGEDDLFRIGSISKTFIWVSLMQLVERGRIALDDPVNKHLPPDLRLPDSRFGVVTVRHLMTHSAGFEDSALGHLFRETPEEIEELEATLIGFRPNRVREAGSLSVYSNYGAALAGALVAHVRNQTFEAAVEETIFGPLGMRSSSFREASPEPLAYLRKLPRPLAPELASRRSDGFSYENGVFRSQPHVFISPYGPAGAASATASDMARYMLMLLNGGTWDGARILTPESVERLLSPATSNAPHAPGMALGFLEYPAPGDLRVVGHDGGTLRFLSSMQLVPELGLGIFVSTNTATGGTLARDLPSAIIARYFDRRTGPPGEMTEKDAAPAPTGAYLPLRRNFSSMEALFLALSGEFRIRSSADGTLILDRGGESRAYRKIAADLYQAVDGPERIAFTRSDTGATTLLLDSFGVGPAERVGFFAAPSTFPLLVALVGFVALLVLRGWWKTKGRKPESRRLGLAILFQRLAAACWLAFGGLFLATGLRMASLGQQAVFDFPGLLLWLSLAVALVAAAMTLLALAALIPVWGESRWTTARRIRHSLATLLWCSQVLMLYHWNLLGFQTL